MTDEEILALATAEIAKSKSMSSDAGSVTRRDVAEIASLYRLIKSINASSNTTGMFGLRVRQCVPGSPAE